MAYHPEVTIKQWVVQVRSVFKVSRKALWAREYLKFNLKAKSQEVNINKRGFTIQF